MQRFLAALILIIALSFFSQWLLPWWTSSIAAAIISFALIRKGFQGFVAGSLGVGLLWLVYGLILHLPSEGSMVARITEMIGLPNEILTFLLTFLIGALVGGLGGLIGTYLRSLIEGAS